MTPPAGTRVLIVEDEAIIAMTAEDMVVDLGCAIAGVASTVEEGFAAIDAGGFDVVLLDINLNGENSMGVAARLLALGLPFIFTTGYGASGPGAQFAHVPVIAKPYRADQIGMAISEVLKR